MSLVRTHTHFHNHIGKQLPKWLDRRFSCKWTIFHFHNSNAMPTSKSSRLESTRIFCLITSVIVFLYDYESKFSVRTSEIFTESSSRKATTDRYFAQSTYGEDFRRAMHLFFSKWDESSVIFLEVVSSKNVWEKEFVFAEVFFVCWSEKFTMFL